VSGYNAWILDPTTALGPDRLLAGDEQMASKRRATTSPEVDAYLARSEKWPKECARLRAILLDCGLREALKWGKPCYAHQGKNIAIIQEFKAFAAVMFFKGALLKDAHGLLEEQGENTRAALRVCFSSVKQVAERETALRDFVRQAVDVEAAGLSVPKAAELVLVDELQVRLKRDPALKRALGALTPGRQREYNLHFSGAKKSETRVSRIEKCVPQILAGKGFRD
jgi:uncharacterized protein YdeI (YjbR/CyaY-like superfamily)